MNKRPDNVAAASAAMLTAAAMIAHQVGGKATRDALFLSTFDVTSLPYMVIGSALFSFGMVFLFARLLSRYGPAGFMPYAFAASALFLVGEWALWNAHPKLASILVYLHMAGLGSVLISGFWSVLNERFDPRAAKRQIGRIAGGATVGGLLGGILAERTAGTLSVAAMLPILGVLHLFCAWRVRGIDLPVAAHHLPARQAAGTIESEPAVGPSPWKLLRQTPYLRNLAILVVLVAISNICLDYVFKARAAETFGRGENLLRFFAIFYTAVALLTLLFQTTLSRRALERLGLARTVGSLPAVVAAGSLGAAAVPGISSATLAWGIGSATADSLYRSGYEILYTPIPPNEKRATKSLVDVGCDRLGDLLGAGMIRLVLLLSPSLVVPSVLGLALGVALIGLWFTRRLNRGYVSSLERSLLNREVELDWSDVKDRTTRSTFLQTLHGGRTSGLTPSAAVANPTTAPPDYIPADSFRSSSLASEHGSEVKPIAVPADPVLHKLAVLRSGDLRSVRKVLREPSDLDLVLVPHVISLLGWDEIAPDAVTSLRRVAPQIADQLVDALLHPEQPFAVRRRIPRVLTGCPPQQAAEALLEGLSDKRFEVRYQCGCALGVVAKQNPEIHFDPQLVFEAVQREATVDKKVWDTQQLLERGEQEYGSSFAGLVRDRTSRSLEHVFRLLALVLPKEPLQIAFRGLHTADENLRGIALEYLESVLPSSVREPLWTLLEDRRPAQRPVRPKEEVLATLMRSHHSIELNLAAMNKVPGREP